MCDFDKQVKRISTVSIDSWCIQRKSIPSWEATMWGLGWGPFR